MNSSGQIAKLTPSPSIELGVPENTGDNTVVGTAVVSPPSTLQKPVPNSWGPDDALATVATFVKAGYRHHYVDAMDFAESAGKHGISNEDALHAIRTAVAELDQYFDGETRRLIIGASVTGELLEVVYLPSREPELVIHVDRLRSKYYYLIDQRKK